MNALYDEQWLCEGGWARHVFQYCLFYFLLGFQRALVEHVHNEKASWGISLVD